MRIGLEKIDTSVGDCFKLSIINPEMEDIPFLVKVIKITQEYNQDRVNKGYWD